jgi:alpha-glutamyl/putrescinyl thymine pyrophosphorylase clade 1
LNPVTPRTAPLGYVRLAEPSPSRVFDTYWRFAVERQAIFLRRTHGDAAPWTDDPVLRAYKFTNAYRAADRVSQYLIQNILYRGQFGLRDTVFRVLLFKLFNKIETWELLETAVGHLDEASFRISSFDKILSAAMNAGASIYSAAYIMPSGPATTRQPRKHRMHLALLDGLLRDRFPEKLAATRSMQAAYELLRSLPSIGPFLAYQFVTDLNYSAHFQFSEMEFAVPGPGARDGMRKCFANLGDYSESDTIRWIADRQEREFAQRGLVFESLWGRPLQLIDCQNLLCEVDKYARVAHPDVSGYSGRTRIKQKFLPATSVVPPWFPPKWNINDRVGSRRQPATGPWLL